MMSPPLVPAAAAAPTGTSASWTTVFDPTGSTVALSPKSWSVPTSSPDASSPNSMSPASGICTTEGRVASVWSLAGLTEEPPITTSASPSP